MTASAGAWYRVGTVNVTKNNATVTGVGSSWQNDVIAIAIGDAFTIDAKTWYEVIAVDSDTSITLDRGFEGTTASGANYAILRNTSGTILTRIAGQIAVQFNQKQLFLDELRNWLTSDDETITLTDSHGIAYAVETLSKIREITGTAATKDVVSSSSDTTEGRVITAGYRGLGSVSATLSYTSYDDVGIGGGGFGFFAANDRGQPLSSSMSLINLPSNVGSSSYRLITPYGSSTSLYLEQINNDISRGLVEVLTKENTGKSIAYDVTEGSTDGTQNRLLKVGDFGLGGDAPFLEDLDDTSAKPGTYRIDSNTLNSVINGVQIIGFVTIRARGAGARVIYEARSEGFDGRFLVRVRNSASASGSSGSGFSGWEEVYTGSNTNLNEFGGVAAGNSIAQGYARTPNNARIYLPITSKYNPTGVSVLGAFTIRANNAVVETGLVPVSNSVSSLSSNRYAIIEFVTSEPMSLPAFIDVISEGVSSKIKVND